MTISIITATYNSAATIADTLNSVLQQTHQDYEIIVIDGVSSDGTLDIVRSFETKMQGKLNVISEPDKGLYDAMNKGLRRATGEVVGILNSDDFFSSIHSLEYIAQTFESQDVEATYADLYFVDPNRIDIPIQYYSSRYYRKWMMRLGFAPAHPTFYCRKEVYDRYEHFDLSMKIGADFELLLRYLFVHNIRTAYIPQYIVTMRTGGISNANMNSRLTTMRERLRAFHKNNVYTNIFLLSLTYIYKAVLLVMSRWRKYKHSL